MNWITDKWEHFLSWLYIRQIWGERCSTYDKGCPCCERWKEHDWMFNGGDWWDEENFQ